MCRLRVAHHPPPCLCQPFIAQVSREDVLILPPTFPSFCSFHKNKLVGGYKTKLDVPGRGPSRGGSLLWEIVMDETGHALYCEPVYYQVKRTACLPSALA